MKSYQRKSPNCSPRNGPSRKHLPSVSRSELALKVVRRLAAYAVLVTLLVCCLPAGGERVFVLVLSALVAAFDAAVRIIGGSR